MKIERHALAIARLEGEGTPEDTSVNCTAPKP